MVVGIGIDLLDVEDVRRSITRFGARYLQRMLTAAEASSLDADPAAVAAVVAAKEATFKALAVRADAAVVWTDVQIDANAVRLAGPLRHAHPGVEVSVSTTSTRDRALAIAVATEL